MYVRMCMCVSVCAHMCACACMPACMHLCLCVCVCVCACFVCAFCFIYTRFAFILNYVSRNNDIQIVFIINIRVNIPRYFKPYLILCHVCEMNHFNKTINLFKYTITSSLCVSISLSVNWEVQ